MPRTARLVVPGVTLHVTQRGHNRQPCFCEDGDYRAYLGYLSEFAFEYGCSVHAYCLMTNHVHFLLTPHAADACANLMKNLGQNHVQRINSRRKRTGTLWQGRFWSCPVTTERYLLACYRYVELNPQRAGMVGHPSDYPWSSYHQNAQGDPMHPLDPHAVYLAIAKEKSLRATEYRALCEVPLEIEVIDEIRRATRGGYVVGAGRRPRGRPWPAVMRKIGSVPI
jgi:putative transposase